MLDHTLFFFFSLGVTIVLISPQVTVPQLSLPNFGSGGGQPLLALPPTPPQTQPPNINRQPPVSQPYRGIMGPNHSMMQPPTSKVLNHLYLTI